MRKITDLMSLLVWLFITAAIYIEANKHYFPVFLIYTVIATIGICIYLWMFFYHNNQIGIAKMNGREVDEELLNKRRRLLKNILIFTFPFLAIVLCDSIFLILINDNPLFAPILKLFK